MLGEKDREAIRRQPVGVAFQRLRVTDAGDPGEQAVEFGERGVIAGDVADADAAVGFEDTLELGGCDLFAGEGAEGALAEDGVEGGVGEGEGFGVGEAKVYAAERGRERLRRWLRRGCFARSDRCR